MPIFPVFTGSLSPDAALDAALSRIADGGGTAVAFGLVAGLILGLSPVALPALPAVAAVVSPAVQHAGGSWRPPLRVVGALSAFLIGMDVPLTLAGYFLSWFAVALTRASVVMSVVTATVLAVAGLWLLLARRDACTPRRAVPPRPVDAFTYGVVFSVTACSGCAALLITMGSAAALVAGPLTAAVVLLFYLVGRTSVLLATAVLGSRLLMRPQGGRTFDVLVGLALLAAAGYYGYLLATGLVSSVPAGEPGSTRLP